MVNHPNRSKSSLEYLYRHVPEHGSEAYEEVRRAKVAEIADYIRDHLKPGIDARRYAEQLMSSAEEMGRIYGDNVRGEVSTGYTTSGKPLPFTV